MNCILCNSPQLKISESISTQELIKMYKRTFNQDVNYIFTNSSIDYVICNNCNLNFFSPECAGDEEFYAYLQQYDWYYRPEKKEYDIASKYINEGDSVLEVGAGFGAFRKYLGNVNYTGLEFSEDAIKLAERRGIKLINDFVENYAEKHEGTYDIVCHFQVLEHVTNPGNFLKGCIKSLKKGGKLIFAVPANDSFLNITPNHALDCPPHHMSRWTDQTLKKIPELFNLNKDKFTIIHPELEDIHYNFYSKSVWQNRLAGILGFKNKIINQSKLYKALGKPADILAKLTNKQMVKTNKPVSLTVICMYEKV